MIHVEIMIRSYGKWGAEITAFTMNLVCRLISLAMCYRDGSPKCKGDMENNMALSEMPSIFKILVYTFNVPSCIASPFYEYKDFEEWMELKGRYKNIPDPKKHAVIRFLHAIGWIVLLYIMGTWFDLDNLLDEKFCQMPFWLKTWHQFWTIGVLKYTYYLVWCFVDSGMISSGLAYNDKDKEGNIKYDRYSNVN